jgi:hypothetical protein
MSRVAKNVTHFFYTAFFSFIVGFILADLWVIFTVTYFNLNGKQVINGNHYHHTFLALPFFAASLIMRKNRSRIVQLVALGLGILFQHYIREGNIHFITQD